MIVIETDRLRVRSFEASDFDSLALLMSDADTMKYTGFKQPQSKEKVRDLLSGWQKEGLQKTGVWCVESKNTGDFVGWVMLKPTNSETPELGYMIRRQSWGHGYASELVAGLLNYAFKGLNLTRVVAVTSLQNTASVRVLEKSGMKRFECADNMDRGISYEMIFRG